MRAFCVIMFSLLFFTACQRQQVKPKHVTPDRNPLVIDYPAGVMIVIPSHGTAPEKRNASKAEKILTPHRIPLLDTNTRQMVFVKTNGDRIQIAIDDLDGKYDIILFNGIANPVPLRIADLQDAFNQIFNFSNGNQIARKNRKYLQQNTAAETDTIVQKNIRTRLSHLLNRDKRIIITSTDTSSRKFIARIIPGIQWVEQRLDTRAILKINFENDLITYANTDRYYTNGINIDLQAAWLSRSMLQKLMIPYRHQAFITYNLCMLQDMYTPTDTKVAPKLKDDRPYSSYLYFGFRKTAADPIRKLKISTQFDAGYLGPYSPGSYLQTLVHKSFPTNDKPQGWSTQINTDIILNYTFQIQKAIVYKKKFSLLVGTDLKSGTLYNNVGAGLQLQAGKADPLFGIRENGKWPQLECYFFAKTHVSIVAYNALLQGGMFNHDNVFTLKGNEIQRVVGTAEAGIHFRHKGLGIELAQHYLSPEYKGGLWHKWGRISLLFKV